ALANNTKADGSDVDEFLSLLFDKLNTSPSESSFPSYLKDFPYVNGGLFREKITCPKFSIKARRLLIESGELDWSEINPDIFGSMIQAVADPEERTNLGMHYTSVENILKVIKPLFLDELEEEFEKNRENPRALNRLLVRLGKIKFFDPACGSGNFLIITYKEIRNLEIQILKQLIDLQSNQTQVFFTEISLDQFYGIEIKDFAHEMAILSLWLAEHQMNQVFEEELMGLGQSKPLLPLKETGRITHGNAARMNWEEACPKEEGDEIYIIGNPPYLGSRKQKKEQKDDMALIFKNFKRYKDLDYIAIWIYKGSNYIKDTDFKMALVSTNSICQGEQVPLLWSYIFELGIKINFAYNSFKWTNNAKGNAGVTVIIIGLSKADNGSSFLYDSGVKKQVDNINAYLIPSKENVFVEKANDPISNLPPINHGNMPADGGKLLFSPEEKEKFILEEPKSKKWFKKLVSVREHLNGRERWCMCLVDIKKNDLEELPMVRQVINEVKEIRENSSRPHLAETPHLFAQITQPKDKDCIIIPRVSSETREYMPIDLLDGSEYKVTDSYFTIATNEPYIFGVVSSLMHMVWVKSIGGRLETRLQYSKTLCYNTFPFPEITEKQKHTLNQYV